jgi:hypothetical protein
LLLPAELNNRNAAGGAIKVPLIPSGKIVELVKCIPILPVVLKVVYGVEEIAAHTATEDGGAPTEPVGG